MGIPQYGNHLFIARHGRVDRDVHGSGLVGGRHEGMGVLRPQIGDELFREPGGETVQTRVRRDVARRVAEGEAALRGDHLPQNGVGDAACAWCDAANKFDALIHGGVRALLEKDDLVSAQLQASRTSSVTSCGVRMHRLSTSSSTPRVLTTPSTSLVAKARSSGDSGASSTRRTMTSLGERIAFPKTRQSPQRRRTRGERRAARPDAALRSPVARDPCVKLLLSALLPIAAPPIRIRGAQRLTPGDERRRGHLLLSVGL